MNRKGILMVLDGYGEGKPNAFNAVDNANTPFLKSLKTLSHSLLKTDGEAVGLFKGEMGGSEVGHTTIGAGRIIPSTAKKINDDVISGDFEKNKKLLSSLKDLKKSNGNLHIFGLCSDKNIHSNLYHAFKVMDIAENYSKNMFLHFVTDGRDSGSFDSLKYLELIKKEINKHRNAEIVSVSGRAYAMDREMNMDRTKLAIKAMFLDKNGIDVKDLESYLKNQHKNGINDQFIEPIHINTKAETKLNKDDLVLVFNFREDRLRQVVKEIENLGCKLITMANVKDVNSVVLYPSQIVSHTLSEHLSSLGLTQIKISETTKYAHVTYFLNGGREQPFVNEDRIHIPTIKVKDFAETPKMKAKEIAEEVIKAVQNEYDAIIVNFSNPDMLGHTGNYEATKKSLEFLDKCVKKVCDFALKNDYFILITADHGNAEQMRNKDGTPNAAHTLNRVCCEVLDKTQHKLKKYGGLKDVAPTFLDLLKVKQNKYFEGRTLLQ